jgi:hypothetical protein
MQISDCRSWKPLASTSVVILLLAGCSSSERSEGMVSLPASASARRVPDTSISVVRPVAERVFRQYFRINPDSSGPALLVAQPQEINSRESPERLRDVLGVSANRHRNLAELRMIQEGPDVVLRCVVQTQRLDTAERSAFARELGDDRPTDTPIDRRGALSANPREDWVSVRRDRGLEQEILTGILESLRSASSPAK